jgi:hypothetical protein
MPERQSRSVPNTSNALISASMPTNVSDQVLSTAVPLQARSRDGVTPARNSRERAPSRLNVPAPPVRWGALRQWGRTGPGPASRASEMS